MNYESPVLEIITFDLEKAVSNPGGGNTCGPRTAVQD